MATNPAYNRSVFFNYLSLFLLIATTGFPFFYSSQEFIFIGFILTFLVFFNRRLKIEKNLIYVVVLFLAIELLQTIQFGKFDPVTFSGTYVRLLFAYFVARNLGRFFFDYYFKMIYVLAIISMIFYIPSLLIDGFYEFFTHSITPNIISPFGVENSFYSTPPNIIVFCFHTSLIESGRNAGPFWEPGAFSIFLILAVMFRLMQQKKLFEPKLIFLYIVIITTFSTTGIIALLILIISFYLVSNDRYGLKYFFAGLFILGGIYIYNSVSFLGEKTQTDMDIAETTTSSRFGSALVDLRDFAQNPITGWGRGENRYAGKKSTFFSVDQHRNNGVTNLLASYGIIIFIYYFYCYFRNLKTICGYYNVSKQFAYFALFILLLLGFSQGIFTRPFFYSLLFVGLPFVFQNNLIPSRNYADKQL